jgi:hypothetical protein
MAKFTMLLMSTYNIQAHNSHYFGRIINSEPLDVAPVSLGSTMFQLTGFHTA